MLWAHVRVVSRSEQEFFCILWLKAMQYPSIAVEGYNEVSLQPCKAVEGYNRVHYTPPHRSIITPHSSYREMQRNSSSHRYTTRTCAHNIICNYTPLEKAYRNCVHEPQARVRNFFTLFLEVCTCIIVFQGGNLHPFRVFSWLFQSPKPLQYYNIQSLLI